MRTTTEVMVLRWRTEMAERYRLMAAWYHDRKDVEMRAMFASRCATRSMIRASFGAMNAVVAELDESMGVIVEKREFPGLMNKAAFEPYESDVPLAPGSPRVVFAYERNAL